MLPWLEFIGRRVKIVFDDFKTGSVKVGEVTKATEKYLCINTDSGEEVITIPRIVRMELLDGGQKNGGGS